MGLKFGYNTNEAGRDIGVCPGDEALGKIDITVGQRTYVFQGTCSQILDHLKKNLNKQYAQLASVKMANGSHKKTRRTQTS